MQLQASQSLISQPQLSQAQCSAVSRSALAIWLLSLHASIHMHACAKKQEGTRMHRRQLGTDTQKSLKRAQKKLALTSVVCHRVLIKHGTKRHRLSGRACVVVL